MDSLPAAGTVRRTVRVAVALVVGQALLVALIGWLTLGRADGSGGTVDQMAAPPATPLPTTIGRHVDPPAPPSAFTSVAVPLTTQRTTAHRRTASTQPPSPPPKPAPATVEPVPTIVVAPTVVPPALAPPSPLPPASPQPSPPPLPPSTSPSVEPGPVVIGDLCAPEGAYAYTAEGVLVRCTRRWHHRLRWKIV